MQSPSFLKVEGANDKGLAEKFISLSEEHKPPPYDKCKSPYRDRQKTHLTVEHYFLFLFFEEGGRKKLEEIKKKKKRANWREMYKD